jgi:hypothetical protein
LRDDLPANLRRNAPEILLRNGSFFGEIALVMEVRRTCSVQARTVCEVNVLQQNAFDAVLRENPHFARKINELVVARQLDSSLARSSHVKGVDFQISQSDMERAVTAMEKNMQEGLARRQLNQPDSFRTIADFSAKSPASAKVKNGTRVSFEEAATRRRHQHDDEESQIEIPNRPSTAGAVPDVIRDITRRSTRFADEDLVKKLRRAHRPLGGSFGTTITLDSFVDTCSDTEVDAPKRRTTKNQQRRPTGFPKERKITTEDELEGHFRPGVFTDIAKVRPVILNPHIEAVDRESERQSLDSRMSYQGRMMEKLITKIDQLESLYTK